MPHDDPSPGKLSPKGNTWYSHEQDKGNVYPVIDFLQNNLSTYVVYSFIDWDRIQLIKNNGGILHPRI